MSSEWQALGFQTSSHAMNFHGMSSSLPVHKTSPYYPLITLGQYVRPENRSVSGPVFPLLDPLTTFCILWTPASQYPGISSKHHTHTMVLSLFFSVSCSSRWWRTWGLNSSLRGNYRSIWGKKDTFAPGPLPRNCQTGWLAFSHFLSLESRNRSVTEDGHSFHPAHVPLCVGVSVLYLMFLTSWGYSNSNYIFHDALAVQSNKGTFSFYGPLFVWWGTWSLHGKKNLRDTTTGWAVFFFPNITIPSPPHTYLHVPGHQPSAFSMHSIALAFPCEWGRASFSLFSFHRHSSCESFPYLQDGPFQESNDFFPFNFH